MVIWHIDDDPVELEVAARLISRSDFGGQVRSFEDPRKALESLSKKAPDLILLDIDMPGMDGWEFLKTVADWPSCPPVIILTASIDPKQQEAALKMPWVKALLKKPLDLHALATLAID